MSNGNETNVITPNWVRHLVEAVHPPGQPIPVGGIADQYAVIPEGARVEDLESYGLRPRRTHECVTLIDTDSFVRYVNHFARPNRTVIFASENPSRFRAVLDYHRADEPGWCDHTATFAPEHSIDWKRWIAQCQSSWVAQEAFALFIESNMRVIRQPASADMLQIASEMQVHRSVEFGESVRLPDGRAQLMYTEEIRATSKSGRLEIPERFLVEMPIFHLGAAFQFEVLLRYRLVEKKLKLAIDINYREELVQAAHADLLAKITNRLTTNANLFQGRDG